MFIKDYLCDIFHSSKDGAKKNTELLSFQAECLPSERFWLLCFTLPLPLSLLFLSICQGGGTHLKGLFYISALFLFHSIEIAAGGEDISIGCLSRLLCICVCEFSCLCQLLSHVHFTPLWQTSRFTAKAESNSSLLKLKGLIRIVLSWPALVQLIRLRFSQYAGTFVYVFFVHLF